MTEGVVYALVEGERLFMRLSSSGKGLYITARGKEFGLVANFDHVKAVMQDQKDFAVFEVRCKETPEAGKKEEKNVGFRGWW